MCLETSPLRLVKYLGCDGEHVYAVLPATASKTGSAVVDLVFGRCPRCLPRGTGNCYACDSVFQREDAECCLRCRRFVVWTGVGLWVTPPTHRRCGRMEGDETSPPTYIFNFEVQPRGVVARSARFFEASSVSPRWASAKQQQSEADDFVTARSRPKRRHRFRDWLARCGGLVELQLFHKRWYQVNII